MLINYYFMSSYINTQNSYPTILFIESNDDVIELEAPQINLKFNVTNYFENKKKIPGSY